MYWIAFGPHHQPPRTRTRWLVCRDHTERQGQATSSFKPSPTHSKATVREIETKGLNSSANTFFHGRLKVKH